MRVIPTTFTHISFIKDILDILDTADVCVTVVGITFIIKS
jgi:hypothetical protein